MLIRHPTGPWVAAVCLLAAVPLAGPAAAGGSAKDDRAAPAVERGSWFLGYDGVSGANFFVAGMMIALDGDQSRDGWVVRSEASRVDYDLDPGDGRGYQADALPGYRFVGSQGSGGIYAGVDWQNYRLKPDDPTEEVRGTQWGFKVAADVETSGDLPYYFGLDGSYSTAFATYWVRGRAGLNRNGMTFGPEAIAMGDEGFDAQRLGGFVTFKLDLLPGHPSFDVTMSGGHLFLGDSNGSGTGGAGGSEGTYGSIVISTSF